MYKFIAVLVTASLVWGAPQTKYEALDLDEKIVGGVPVKIEDYPYQVALEYMNEHICGGSIISDTYVVTAAHCTDGKIIKYLKIRTGSTLREKGGVLVEISKIDQHPNYKGTTIDCDISILRLNTKLTFGPGTNKIQLPKLNQIVPIGTLAVVSGWGHLKFGGESPKVLQAVKLPIVDWEYCKKANVEVNVVTERMICAGYPDGGKDHCHGDSGGPLVAGGELIGVVSWGKDCALPNYPGVYASVPKLRDYIEHVTGL